MSKGGDTRAAAAANGKRVGRPKGAELPPRPDKKDIYELLTALDQPAKVDEPYRVKKWRELTEAQDLRVRLDARKYLTDQCYSKASQPMDFGDKPLSVIVDIPSAVTRRAKERT